MQIVLYNKKMEINLQKLFNPHSIAIVGASEKEGKVGNAVAKNILERGYAGEVFLVNPKHTTLFERKCYTALESIEQDVDLAIIIVPAEYVNAIIEKAAVKVKNFVVISAGFSETGAAGKKKEEELAALAEEKNLNILGPNCLGFIIPNIKLNASFAGGMPEAGNIALVSQSGALAVALMDMAQKEKMRFSGLVSIGNKAQLSEAELIAYFGADPATQVIGIYLEGIKNGKKFMETVQRVAKVKPVVILKSGKTQKAQEAITTHTGSLAGSDQVMDAVFAKVGVLRADNLETFLNLLRLISITPPPVNEEAIVITNAGGPGVLVTDAFEGGRLKLAEFSDDLKSKLKEFLPAEAAINNPIDLLGDAQADRYQQALEVVSRETAGTIICILTPQDQTPVDKIADILIEFKKKTDKIILAVFIGGDRIERAVAALEKKGIYNFLFPHQALSALNKYYAWSAFSRAKREISKLKIDIKRAEKSVEIIKKAQVAGRKALLFPEARDIMKMYALKTVAGNFLAPGAQLPRDAEFPVVVKVESDAILHKTEKSGVILNVKNKEELAAAVAEIRTKFPGAAALIQPMQDIQTELILGIKKDEIFGPILVCGLGGIYTEVFGLVDFLVPPMELDEIEDFLRRSKISYLFQGVRGKAPHNIQEIANILAKLMLLAQEIEEINGLDINPLLVYNDGKEAIAVDVKIIV